MPQPLTDYEAVLFDLDGVLTDTAHLHAVCWKQMFDDYLQAHAQATGTPYIPFDLSTDYRLYVDGRPRYEGVATFLDSRRIHLPQGQPADPPGMDSVCALGNQKNALIQVVLEQEGVEVYDGSLRLVHALQKKGVRMAVVSSSKNAAAVLKAAGIDALFELRVDGVVAAERGLKGKPAPDTFLFAAQQMQVAPAQAVVIEDAISGVQAGRVGQFGLVVGVDRHHEAAALREAGADMVVDDLAQLL